MDEGAIKISTILTDANYEEAVQYVNIGSGLQKEIFLPFVDYLDLESKKHYLVLIQAESSLLCFVKLSNLFTIGITLSNQKHLDLEEAIIGINDPVSKKFSKIKMTDVLNHCLGPLHTRFVYFFKTEKEVIVGQEEINQSGFSYEGQADGLIPIYKKDGSLHQCTFSDVLEQSKFIDKSTEEWNIQYFEFDQDEEYFVKSLKSKSLYQVVAFEMRREKISKI